MMEETGVYLISGLFNLLPELLILGACIFYLTKRVEADGILLITGSIIAILATAFYSIAMPLMIARGSLDTVGGSFQTVNIIIRVVAIFGTVAFAAGLFILFDKIKKPGEE